MDFLKNKVPKLTKIVSNFLTDELFVYFLGDRFSGHKIIVLSCIA